MRNPFAVLAFLAVFAVLGCLWAFAPSPALSACSLDGLIAECEGDPACRGVYPKLRQERETVLPEARVAKADLERLPGTYANGEMGMVLKVDLVGESLRVSILQGPPFPPALLIPTSPTRFRWEGDGMAPGLALVFQVAEGKATALSVVQPNKPAPVVMKRSD